MDRKEIQYRCESVIAMHYMHKEDAFTYAKELLKSAPQTWAYAEVQDQIKSDGFRVTQKRKDMIWEALGGK